MPAGRRRALLAAAVVALLLAGAWALLLPVGLPWSGPLSWLVRPDPASFGPAVAEAHAECARLSGGDGRACYERALGRVVAAEGPGAALEVLEGLAAVDRSARSDAHHHAHHIGIEAYRHGDGLAEVFPRCTEAFSSGCYHGVIQAHFLARGGADETVLRETCAPYGGPGGDRWLHFQCLHGLGHGLVLHLAGDLFGALDACDVLRGSYARESCYGGAFMQNIVDAFGPGHGEDAHGHAGGQQDDAHRHTEEAADVEHGHAHAGHGHAVGADAREPVPPAIDPDDPLYPCTAVEPRHARACYGMQSSAILRLTGDLREVARTCAEAPEEGRDACFEGLARDVSGRARFDPRRAHRSCTRLQEEGERWCYTGVARNMVNFEAHPDRAFTFCRRVEEPEDRSACFRTTGGMLRYLEPDAEGRRQLCEEADDPADVEACLRGAVATRSAG